MGEFDGICRHPHEPLADAYEGIHYDETCAVESVVSSPPHSLDVEVEFEEYSNAVTRPSGRPRDCRDKATLIFRAMILGKYEKSNKA